MRATVRLPSQPKDIIEIPPCTSGSTDHPSSDTATPCALTEPGTCVAGGGGAVVGGGAPLSAPAVRDDGARGTA